MIEKLYTVEEVAQLASVTGRTIRNYLKSGRLVGRKIGGQWRFPESEVQRLLSGGGSPAEMEAFEDAPAYEPEPAPYAPEPTYTPEPAYREPQVSYSAPSAPAAPTPPVQENPARSREPVLQNPPSASQPVLQPTAPSHGYTPASGILSAPANTPAPTGAPARTAPQAESLGANAFAGNRPASPAPIAPANPAAPQMPQNTSSGYGMPAPSGSAGTYNAPAPLPTDVGVPPAPSTQAPGGEYPDYGNNGYTPEQYTETYEYNGYDPAAPAAPAEPEPPAASAPTQAATHQPSPQPEEEYPGMPALSDTGLKVLQFVAEVHDCTAGPQTCTVIEVIHSLSVAQATITQLANLAAQESGAGIPCECYVEYDERFSVARYTLFGSALYLARGLQIIA